MSINALAYRAYTQIHITQSSLLLLFFLLFYANLLNAITIYDRFGMTMIKIFPQYERKIIISFSKYFVFFLVDLSKRSSYFKQQMKIFMEKEFANIL